MKHNTYQNAVDHLEFTDNLSELITKKESKPRSVRRVFRAVVLAAVMICVLATSALAVSPEFRNWRVSLMNLGISRQEMTNADVMEFRHEESDGMSIHYLELDKTNYSFAHGFLFSPRTGGLRITEDYRLEQVELEQLSAGIEKNGRSYSVELSYFESEEGIISPRKHIYRKNEQGEVFLIATDGNSNQWPVYVNLDSGNVRDALPEWTEEDFSGRVGYGYELRGGILISTIVDEYKTVNGNSVSYNQLYWIENGASEAVQISLPENEFGWYCENDTLYCKNLQGHLFRWNEDMEFELVYSYETGDDLTNGLYTVATENGELAVIDVLTGDIYEIADYLVDPGCPDGFRVRSGGDIDETMGYNATRYSPDGKIALIRKEWLPEEGRVALQMLAVLDPDSSCLKILEIENDHDGYMVQWLDENRLAVIYDEKYLCIYEFVS